MTRRLSLAALLLLALQTGCSDGNQGAVSVRWRITDLSTGVTYDPLDRGASDGSGACVCQAGDRAAGCAASYGWVVHAVRLIVADPESGAPVAVADPYVLFACKSREATTPFHIPPGSWALSLRAYNPAAPQAGDEGTTPAPVVRDVRAASITKLDVIQIGVHRPPVFPPVPDGGADGGAADGGSPDLAGADFSVPNPP
jgi:hypothetical protein